jgi:hypothetical protein
MTARAYLSNLSKLWPLEGAVGEVVEIEVA